MVVEVGVGVGIDAKQTTRAQKEQEFVYERHEREYTITRGILFFSEEIRVFLFADVETVLYQRVFIHKGMPPMTPISIRPPLFVLLHFLHSFLAPLASNAIDAPFPTYPNPQLGLPPSAH